MMNGSNVDPLTAAIAFAARAHEGQTCRSTDAPKIVHPMEVAAIAATMTSDHEILAAAMLHDVIESCGVTEDALKGEFGDRIAKLVRAMSEEKGLDAEEGWQKRKLFSINRLRAASHDQLILTLSDKLSSLRAIRRISCRADRSRGWLSPALSRWSLAASYSTNRPRCSTRRDVRRSCGR